MCLQKLCFILRFSFLVSSKNCTETLLWTKEDFGGMVDQRFVSGLGNCHIHTSVLTQVCPSKAQYPHWKWLAWRSEDPATSLQCDLRQVHFPHASSDSCPEKGAWDWLGHFVKIQDLEPQPRNCNSVGLWWGPGVCECHDRWLWSCESLSTWGPRRDLLRPVRISGMRWSARWAHPTYCLTLWEGDLLPAPTFFLPTLIILFWFTTRW